MGNYEIILDTTKEIETLLGKVGARGKGLHEKVNSVENKLSAKIVQSIRFLATIRNNFLHNSDFVLTDELLNDFKIQSKEVISYLTSGQVPEKTKSDHIADEDLLNDKLFTNEEIDELFNDEEINELFKSEGFDNTFNLNNTTTKETKDTVRSDYGSLSKTAVGVGLVALGGLALLSWFGE